MPVHVVWIHIDGLLQNVEFGSCWTEATLASKIDNPRGSPHADPHEAVVKEVPLAPIKGRPENGVEILIHS